MSAQARALKRLALLEAPHVGFILRDPTCHLLAGEFSWLRRMHPLRAHPGGKKKHQLLLFFRDECFRRRLNFIEFSHASK